MALVTDLLKDIAQRVRPCPQVSMQRAYVRAAREFCRQSQWYGVNLTAVLVAGTAIYDVNALGSLEALNIDSVSLQPLPAGNGVRPVPMNRGDPSQFVPGNTAGQPVRYGYLPEGAIAFDPPPNGAYPVTVRVICQPILEAVEVPDEILVKWQTALEAGALAYLYSLSGEPWADTREAMLQQRVFQGKINDARADRQRGYMVGSVRARPQSFVSRGFGWRSP
jgi:hypothetical protein